MICILTWNREIWAEDKMQDLMDRFHKGEEVTEDWKCYAHNMFGLGSRVFVSRTGEINPGLIGSGFMAEEPHFDEEEDSWYVKVKFDYLSPLATEVVIPREILVEHLKVPVKAFAPQRCGISYPGDCEQLERMWQEFTCGDISYPDEVPDTDIIEYTEGAVKEVKVNRYERDSRARLACIAHHGTRCKACGIDLKQVYGAEIAKDYIHVHHLRQLKDIGREYTVNPIDDLIPLCPNCHAMIHQSDPVLTVDSLRTKIWDQYVKLFVP